MRIISQNGEIDIPYDKIVVSISQIDDTKIIAWWYGCDESEIVDMAEYESNEKALKSLEMMRNNYLSRMELEGGYSMQGYYIQPNFWVLPRVFQFPRNEEIE